jgi:hypothetical protein
MMANITYTESITLVTETCITCGIMFAIPSDYRERLIETHKSYHCPNGHTQFYSGKNEAEKLKDELKRKEQELANTAIEKIRLQNQLTEKERMLKRVHKGVCPCCNRSFVNLQRHMKTKHPEAIKKHNS